MLSSAALAQEQVPAVPALAPEEVPKVTAEQVQQALDSMQSNTDLNEEQRGRLVESYQRTLSQLQEAEQFNGQKAAFDTARATARDQADKLRGQLEQASGADKPVTLDPGLSLEDMEQVIQVDRAELAAQESSLADTRSALASEVERPATVRQRLVELKQRDSELAAELQALPPADGGLEATAGLWALSANASAVKAEIASLTAEQLSQPMRQDLLKAQQDSTGYAVKRLTEKIELYEARATELRQQAAEEAQSQALSEQAELADSSPVVQKMAEENTRLSAHTTQLTSELDQLRNRSREAEAQAQRIEQELESSQRKLEVVGMSQAMGQVLREQQARLPRARVSRGERRDSGERISASSLRVLQYQDERRRLRELDTYIGTLTAELPPAEAEQAAPKLEKLAMSRRDLLDRALQVENTYLRALGELDFNSRRLQQAAASYNSFISERLLWIRSSSSLSLSALAGLPGEISMVFSPSDWAVLLGWLVFEGSNSPLAMLLAILFALLVLLRPWLKQQLKETANFVGNVERDRISYTTRALVITMLLALQGPFLMWSLGQVLFNAPHESPLGNAAAWAATRMSYYFLGIEFLRQMSADNGLLDRHFQWSTETLHALSRRLLNLELVFVPAGAVVTLSSRYEGLEGATALTDLAMMVTLGALVYFYLRAPTLFQSSLENWAQVTRRTTESRGWGRRIVRYLLIILPCLMMIGIAAGYTETAISFLILLLLTNVLFVVVMLIQDFGLRWLRIIRRRLVRNRRRKALEAARARREESGAEIEEFNEEEPDPNEIDDNARKLLSTVLYATALLGLLSIWGGVLPALGILDSVELWQGSDVVDGQTVAVAVTLADLGWALLLGFLGYVAIQRIPSLLEVVLRQRVQLATGTTYAMVTLFRYTLIAIVAITVIATLGGRWSQIQWAVAGLGVGIGFGLQEVVANFICGLIILFEQPIRVGDVVTVGETSGTVTRIRMRATTIRDWDRFELLVPNKEFVTGRLLNWSLSDALNRITIKVGVAYGTNLREAMDIALDVAKQHPEVVDDPGAFITFDDFGDNSLLLVLRCYLNSVDNRLTVSSQLRTEINDRYNAAGIVVAFPQRDVHLDTSNPLEVLVRESGARDLPG